MKIYIVTHHHFESGYDSFKTAAFSTHEKAEQFMRDCFTAAVDCFKKGGCVFEDEEHDAHIEADRAWVILSHNDRDERQFHITEVELDEENFSRAEPLD